jgi:hypothetical protein
LLFKILLRERKEQVTDWVRQIIYLINYTYLGFNKRTKFWIEKPGREFEQILHQSR